MNKQIFLSQIISQFIDANSISLTMDDDFRNVESYDSLTGMSILVMITDEYGVDLSVDEYKEIRTVEGLFQLVNSKI
jgi:acyl carrier protein